MILLTMQAYLCQFKKVTLSNLAKEFNFDEKIIEDMLSLWVKKGKLKKNLPETEATFLCATGCGNCPAKCLNQASSSRTIIYEWVD